MGRGKKVLEDKTPEIREKWFAMKDHLDERGKRIWAATEAHALGWGGVTCIAEATGLARSVIHEGLEELANPEKAAPVERIRRSGGGRKKNRA
jgi:DNA-binding phage protein